MKIAIITPNEDGRGTTAIRDGINATDYKPQWIDPRLYSISDYVNKGCRAAIVGHKTNDDIIEKIQKPVIIWYPDIRNLSQYKKYGILDTFSKADYVFVKSTAKLNKLRSTNKNTYYFKQSVSPKVYKPQPKTNEYKTDVVFAGSVEHHFHQERIDWVDRLEAENFDFSLYGDRNNPAIIDPTEYSKMCRSAKINVDMSAMLPESEGYLSARAYQVWGCGGFLIARRSYNMEDYFPIKGDNKICDTWLDIDELVDKCYYYINHPGERKKIARNGLEWFKEEGSSVHVVKRILDKAGL